MRREPTPPQRVAAEAWRRLARAADDPLDPLRIITLCTVTPEGRPDGRLMLLRGADAASRRIWCHSRRESAKVAQLRADPWFAAVAYDPADAVQMRLSGSARVHELDEEVAAHVEQSLRAKQSAPGQLADVDPVWPDQFEALVQMTKRASLKHFTVLELLVDTIDWTEVIGERVVHVFVDAGSQGSCPG